MKWATSRGFTIVEVMIVLGISGVILATSIAVFAGRRASTEFSQAMYDLQSKFQSISNQASTASLPSQDYVCAQSSTAFNGKLHPFLTPTNQTSDSQSNQACIYLGKATQIIPGGDTIYTYTVLGLRTDANGDYPSTSAEANPEPALDATGNIWYLVDAYQLLNGAKVVSATVGTSATEQDLLAIYTSLQSGNYGNQTETFSRDVSFSPSDVKSVKLRDCIEEVNCGSTNTLSSPWKLCVESDSGTQKAELSIASTASGVKTSLNMAGCS